VGSPALAYVGRDGRLPRRREPTAGRRGVGANSTAAPSFNQKSARRFEEPVLVTPLGLAKLAQVEVQNHVGKKRSLQTRSKN